MERTYQQLVKLMRGGIAEAACLYGTQTGRGITLQRLL
ncbi:Uncharacterised protein [Tatumella ptyseos]|uniref:Uncharacterized protein n=1 Tax=Tatumella ptyseos TaxID=82987 RepID=A0A2X5P2I2_9GAMM|nr:Uncharacterised protein [Tatumella ptyseos]